MIIAIRPRIMIKPKPAYLPIQLLRTAAFAMALLHPIVNAAEDEQAQIIILSRDAEAQQDQKVNETELPDASAFTESEIVPIEGGGRIIALRRDDSREAVYSFQLEQANLVSVLFSLAKTIEPGPVTAESVALGQNVGVSAASNIEDLSSYIHVVIEDESAHDKLVSFQVEEASITETIDQAAIASGCNIYIDGETIVVDFCEN